MVTTILLVGIVLLGALTIQPLMRLNEAGLRMRRGSLWTRSF